MLGVKGTAVGCWEAQVRNQRRRCCLCYSPQKIITDCYCHSLTLGDHQPQGGPRTSESLSTSQQVPTCPPASRWQHHQALLVGWFVYGFRGHLGGLSGATGTQGPSSPH